LRIPYFPDYRNKEDPVKRVPIVVSVAAAIVVTTVLAAHAGWALKSNDGEDTVISKGKMKSSWENGAVIFIADEDKIYVVDDGRKMIASGTVDEFCIEMKQGIEKMMEQIPAEQREAMKQMMGGGEPPKVEIVEKGKGERVSGFDTKRYDVMADGELYEEVWIAQDKALVKECMPVMKMVGRFISCMGAIASMGAPTPPEASQEYLKLFDLGMMVKSVGHSDEKVSGASLDFAEIEKKDVPDGDFALPAGYKEVSFATVWGMGQ